MSTFCKGLNAQGELNSITLFIEDVKFLSARLDLTFLVFENFSKYSIIVICLGAIPFCVCVLHLLEGEFFRISFQVERECILY